MRRNIEDISGRPNRKRVLESVLVKSLLPLVLINLVIGNQFWALSPIIGPFLIGQIINWMILAVFSYLVIKAYPTQIWPVFVILMAISSKSLSLALGQPDTIESIYQLSTFILYIAMGVVYLRRDQNLIYKQIMIICLLNLILMILQLSGAGEWTMFLNTENERISNPTIFTSLNYLNLSIAQVRPSGFFYANNIISGIILFALALHFSRDRNRLWWGTFMLTTIIVVCSARIVYLGYIIIGLFLILYGSRHKRIKYIYSFLLTLALLWLYSIFFPGVFSSFWTAESLLFSVWVRINDIVLNLDSGSILKTQLENYLIDTPKLKTDATGDDTSGYSLIIRVFPYFIGLLIIIVPFYLKRFKKQRIILPQLTWVTTLCLIIIIIYPGAIPIWKSQFYWFFAGFAMSPLFINFKINNFRYRVL